jgi:hypothetical protein
MDLLSRLLHVSDIAFGSTKSVVKFEMSMVRIVYVKQIAALFDMVCTTKEYINLLRGDLLGFRDHEPDKNNQKNVSTHKEERFPKYSVSPSIHSDDMDSRLRLTAHNWRKGLERTG